MNVEILADAEAVALRAARWLAASARAAAARRGQFLLAVSGGRTPWQMLRVLAAEDVPWDKFHLFQVDERVAPEGDPERNLTHVRESLLATVRLPAGQLHPMPVDGEDLRAAAAQYQREIEAVAGTPAVFDAIHLGLGDDGHTASLVPGDPVLDVDAADVAITRTYAGRLRMTLTYPAIDRARSVLWVVTGAEKATVLPRLVAGDRSIPAGRVRRADALVLADRAAAAGVSPGPV